MKRLFSIVASLLCVAFVAIGVENSGASYTGTTSGSANFGKKKFYINPGHGGYDSNDRPTALPCGVAMFYESDGNLDRAIHLKNFLVANNANVRLSRTKNTSSDDLGLSAIASYANSYGGYFMSLHSNGANASANYVVSFFRSTSSAPSTEKIAGSKSMAKKASDWHDACTLSDQTYETPRALADYSFYGYNLGVLRTNNCVGYLMETWFHDYRPEALRMKSTVYNKFLAWQLFRAAMDNPGASGTTGSVVMGDIRDLSKSCGYTNYTTRNRDKYKAINGAKVKLLSSSGAELQSMTTDNCENGFYAFFDLAAGTYKVQVSKDGYKTTTKSFTIGTSAQTKLNFDLTEGTDTGILVSLTSLSFEELVTGATSTKSVTVTASDVTGNIEVSCDNPVFTLSTTTLSSTGGSFSVTFAPTSAGSYTGTITLKGGSYTRTMIISGTAKNAPLSFTEKWNYSETSGVNAADGWSADKTKMRNMCYGDGKLYVVNAADAEILIINATTGAKEGTVCKDGVADGVLAIMDVQYVDGKLVASNLADNKTPLKVYVWNNGMNAAPSVLLNTTEIGGFTRIGDTFSIKGNLTNGVICYAAGGISEQNKIVTYKITNGVVATIPTTVNVSTDGTDGITIGLSPRVVPDTNSDKYWIMGQNYYPSLVSADGILEATLNATALKDVVQGNAFVPFTFRGAEYAFATTYLPKAESVTSQSITGGRVVLLDGTGGWAEAENVGEYPSAGLSNNTRNTSFSGAVAVAVNGDQGIDMWVLVHNQGIAHYSYGISALTPKLYVSEETMAFEHTMGNVYVSKEIEVNGVNLTGDVNLALSGDDADAFVLSSATISKSVGCAKLSVKYAPTEVGEHTATLTISTSGAESVKVELSGECVPNYTLDDKNIKLTEGWNFSTNGTEPSYIDLKDNVVRAVAYRDGKLYVLQNKAWATPVVTIVDAYTGALKGTLDMTGIGSATIQLSDILAVDGKIIGCACVTATQTLRIYQWDGDTSAPKVLLEQVTGKIMGGSMSISGNLTDGRLWFTNDGTSEVYYYTITNGVVNSTLNTISLMKADGTTAWNAGDGRGSAEVILNSDGSLWIDAKDEYPALFNVSGTKATITKTMSATAFGSNKYGTALRFFTFGDRKLAASVTYKSSNTNGQLVLIDTSAGVGSETLLETHPTAGLGVAANGQRVSTVCVSTDRNDGMSLDIWVCVNGQGVAYYKYDGKVEGETNAPEGDVNTDGLVDVSDVMSLANYILGKSDVQVNTNIADVNKDGSVDVADVMALANKILGK